MYYYSETTRHRSGQRVSGSRILLHTTLVFLTGGLWLIPLAVRYLLSK